MPVMSGLEVAEAIRAECPEARSRADYLQAMKTSAVPWLLA
jgi:CheY-like chemotaxis protein